jgi:hypothetical protein
MGIYLKWSTIILAPALIAGIFIFYFLHKEHNETTRQELDRVHDARQIERLERQRMEKARKDEAYERKQREL